MRIGIIRRMRSTVAVAALALLAASCAPAAKPAGDGKPIAAAKYDLTGLPAWDAGDGDLAAAAAALAKDEDFAKMREMMTPEQMAGRSESTFKNVQVLDGMTAQRFMGVMHGMRESLDVRCPFCHDPENFVSDEKNEKKISRQMLFVAQRINTEHFDSLTRVTCWTCHRGKEKPEQPLGSREKWFKKIGAMPLPPGLAMPPEGVEAGKVYKNLKVLNQLPANQLLFVMRAFSDSLGKDCAFCHVPEKWESDEKPEKRITRAMVQLTHRANGEIFGTSEDEDSVGCWTCHRGAVKPERLPGVTDLPKAPAKKQSAAAKPGALPF